MPEWRSSHDRVRRIFDSSGNEIESEWTRKRREFRFNVDRTMLVVTGLVIAEVASWIDRYA